ncbi:hypothetical protein BT96DRAFT_997807 [Gymnopus androsaceus JB14]|uniref:Uncharacterized protein n=1 Tax=Gymnopus androsaceus JB14 TaxID=1447944 RepID=A0A6A4HCC7_9AGAR|nr:hypothetical protein BT96DRAFT_997807 [Gymnopus androsaceus JB14]
MTPLRGTSAFGDRWGQTIYSVALSGDGRFNVSMPKMRCVSRQMQLDEIMLRPGTTLTPEELEQAKKLKRAIEEDDDQQQYLLLTVNDEGQQAADPTSTAPNPSHAPNVASKNPLTLLPKGARNPMPYLHPPSMWREWGERVLQTQEENPDVLGSPGLLKPASLETVHEEDGDSIYTNKGEDYTACPPRSPQSAGGTRRENPIPEPKQNASATQVFWTIGELLQTQPECTRSEPDVGRIIGRGDQEEGGIRGNQNHTQWLPYSIPIQPIFQPPTQSPQNPAPPTIPPNTQGAPPPVQPQGPANILYVYRPPTLPPAPFIQAPNQLNWNWNYVGAQGQNANMGGGPPNPGRPGGPPGEWGVPPAGPPTGPPLRPWGQLGLMGGGGPPGGPYGRPPPGPPPPPTGYPQWWDGIHWMAIPGPQGERGKQGPPGRENGNFERKDRINVESKIDVRKPDSFTGKDCQLVRP